MPTKREMVTQRLLSGEAVDANDVTQEIGCHFTVFYGTKRDLMDVGYLFRKTGDRVFQCINTNWKPPERQIEALRERKRAEYAVKNARTRQQTARTHQIQRRATKEEVEASRQRAVAAVAAREEREMHAKVAAAAGHTLSLHTDVGPSILGMPLEAKLTNGTESNGTETNGMMGTALPFAGKVQVFAMYLKEDGTLRFGIQSDDTRWFADVVGEIAR